MSNNRKPGSNDGASASPEPLRLLPAIAARLRQASDRDAMLADIAPYLSLPVTEQIDLVMALGQQRGDLAGDALVVATALEALGSERAMTKEARRAIVRLRSTGTRTNFSVPAPVAPPISREPLALAPTFVTGWASRTRNTSEIFLALLWTRPGHPTDVDGFVFSVNYWEGTFAFVSHPDPMSQRGFEREILDPLKTRMDFAWQRITEGQARYLYELGLEQREWRQETSDSEWLEIEPVISRRLVTPAVTADASIEPQLYDPDLSDEEALLSFWGAWSFGDFALCYDLLHPTHALRERETRDDFIATRRAWYREAKPARFTVGTLTKQTNEQATGIWIPTRRGISPDSRNDYTFFWSLELDTTQLNGTLPEMHLATIVNPESRRHYFWSQIAMERDATTRRWLVGRIRDTAAAVQSQAPDQLVQRSDEIWQAAEQATERDQSSFRNEEDVQAHALAIMAQVQESLSYGECALMRLPADRTLHDRLRTHAVELQSYERAAAIVQKMMARFPDQQSLLHDLTGFDYMNAQQFARQGDEVQTMRWLELALANGRKLLEIERSAHNLAVLGELLSSSESTADEAEALLRESIALEPTLGAWLDLGDLLMRKGESVEAVHAFEAAAKLDPAAPQPRWRLGRALESIDRGDEARLVYEDALAQNPSDATAHGLLGNYYFAVDEFEKAAPHLEQALRLGLVSPQLLVQLANIEARRGNNQQAHMLLDQAALLDPRLADDIRRFKAEVGPDTGGKPKRSR